MRPIRATVDDPLQQEFSHGPHGPAWQAGSLQALDPLRASLHLLVDADADAPSAVSEDGDDLPY